MDKVWFYNHANALVQVRCLGDVTVPGSLDTLREVDEIFVQGLKDDGLYDQIWQAFAVFLPIRSVGVQVRLCLYTQCGYQKSVNCGNRRCGYQRKGVVPYVHVAARLVQNEHACIPTVVTRCVSMDSTVCHVWYV